MDKKKNVSIYYPIFENTIEGVIYDILDSKKRIISTVLGDNQQNEIGDTVEEILNSINKQ